MFNLVIFSLKNVKQGHKLELTSICLLDHAYEVLLTNIKNGLAKVAKKAFNMGRSGTQYVATVTELLSLYWRAHLVESYCKVSNISFWNSPRYLFLSYFMNIWLSSVWCHQLANLHNLKTWISLERKGVFNNRKQHFSAHEVYLFMFQNGLDRKDAIFVIVPLKVLYTHIENNWTSRLMYTFDALLVAQ